MTFTEALAAIPANQTTGDGRGLSISILKALTHATLIQAADANEYVAMPADVRAAEINAIAEHLDAQHLITPPAASTAFATMLDQLRQIGTTLATEAAGWNEQTTRDNLASLTDRIMTICRSIDHELGGITEAETGDRI